MAVGSQVEGLPLGVEAEYRDMKPSPWGLYRYEETKPGAWPSPEGTGRPDIILGTADLGLSGQIWSEWVWKGVSIPPSGSVKHRLKA